MLTKPLKALLLLILLGMPVLFYLFLQSFGENQYEIPVYYQEGIPEQLPGCEQGEVPHSLNPFFQNDICGIWPCSELKGKQTIISLVKSDCQDQVISQVARINNIFRDEPAFHSVTLPLDSVANPELIYQQRRLYAIPEGLWSWWSYQKETDNLVRCGLNQNLDCISTNKVILVDKHYKIRGVYTISDVEEMDRLVTEFQILLAET